MAIRQEMAGITVIECDGCDIKLQIEKETYEQAIARALNRGFTWIDKEWKIGIFKTFTRDFLLCGQCMLHEKNMNR